MKMALFRKQLLLFLAVLLGGAIALGAPRRTGRRRPAAVRTVSRPRAKYRICMPAFWNGGLIVYAHGLSTRRSPSASLKTR